MAQQLPPNDRRKGIIGGNKIERRREILEDAEKTMNQIAEDEARSVREALESEYDRNTPVSVLVFQPVMSRGQHVGRLPLWIKATTYAWSFIIVVLSAFLSALLVRRKLDGLDLVAVLKSRE
jgi:ABC-type antimicrobial peptide transport system permease subunit